MSIRALALAMVAGFVLGAGPIERTPASPSNSVLTLEVWAHAGQLTNVVDIEGTEIAVAGCAVAECRGETNASGRLTLRIPAASARDAVTSIPGLQLLIATRPMSAAGGPVSLAVVAPTPSGLIDVELAPGVIRGGFIVDPDSGRTDDGLAEWTAEVRGAEPYRTTPVWIPPITDGDLEAPPAPGAPVRKGVPPTLVGGGSMDSIFNSSGVEFLPLPDVCFATESGFMTEFNGGSGPSFCGIPVGDQYIFERFVIGGGGSDSEIRLLHCLDADKRIHWGCP